MRPSPVENRRDDGLAVPVQQDRQAARIAGGVEHIVDAGVPVHPDLRDVHRSLGVDLFKAFVLGHGSFLLISRRGPAVVFSQYTTMGRWRQFAPPLYIPRRLCYSKKKEVSAMTTEFPWERLNRVILNCGAVHEEHGFGANAVEQMGQLIPYDQARVYFFNDDTRIYDEVLVGVDQQVVEEYFAYYAQVENGHYDVIRRIKAYHDPLVPVLDWQGQKPDRFQREHLYPQGIHYSTGLLLRDPYNAPRILFCLDRTGQTTFSHLETELLGCLGAHLNNLYQNFYAVPRGTRGDDGLLERLTPRETEICRLLRRGATPAAIAEKLCIARPTVYKHLANLHEKLGVSNRQELLLRLTDARL